MKMTQGLRTKKLVTLKKESRVVICAAGLVIAAIGCDAELDPMAARSPAASDPLMAQMAARAETFTDNDKVPIDIVVFVPCANGGAGEDVLLSGVLHVMSHTTVNGNRFNSRLRFQPQGIRGVGRITGDKYQGTGVTQFRIGGSLVNGAFERTDVNNFRIIGQGPGNNFLVHETFHITSTANFELTVYVSKFRVDCK